MQIKLLLSSIFVISLDIDADDPCNEPIYSGPCMALNESYGHDKQTNTCKKFNYGGCHGNSNRFNTKKECEKACVKPCTYWRLTFLLKKKWIYVF